MLAGFFRQARRPKVTKSHGNDVFYIIKKKPERSNDTTQE